MREFVREFSIGDETRVLDIGGTEFNWSLVAVRPRLTMLNLPRAREAGENAVTWVVADGCALPFRDGAFDVVFSNSVIEHVGGWERQREFALEVMRVGKRYCVQTPNRWFPVETHLMTPFIHYFPKRWQAPVVRRWTVWAAMTGIDGERKQFFLEHYLADIRLLDVKGLRELFPAAAIVRERAMGFTKSLTATYRG